MEEKYTIEQVAETWLLYKKHSLKMSTYYKYKNDIKRYIIPYFGSKTLKDVEQEDLNLWIDEFIQDNQIKSFQSIVVILKSILRFAEKKYDYKFKLDLVTVPKSDTKEIEILSKKDREKLERYCKKDLNNFRNVGIIVCLYTGVRIGEICALTWNDIDLKNEIIRINKTIQRIYVGKNNTFISIDAPKSKKSNRKIPTSPKILEILKEIKTEHSYTGKEYFLTGKEDKFIEPRNYQYAFHKILKECGIERCKFHNLRHTFATNCIEHGVDIKALSVILGHSSVDITLNKYVHSSLDFIKKQIDKL